MSATEPMDLGGPGDAFTIEGCPMFARADGLPDAAPPRSPARPDHQEDALDVEPMEEISGASRRLRALAALSGSLTDSLAPEEAADLVEQQALSALGASSAVVMTLGHFPPAILGAGAVAGTAAKGATTLGVLHAIGLSAELREALDQLALTAKVPLAEVAREGEPIYLSTEDDLRRYPGWGAAMIRAGSRAAAIVPVWANGELRGVLGLAWSVPRAFDEDERAFVLTLGVMCAQAIMRAHLGIAERKAREAAEAANLSKTNFLAMLSHELRTPMNAVIGYTELLSDEIDGPVSATQKDHLGRMRASGRHLLGLIEELLVYARLEAGEEVVRAEFIFLGDVVEQSLVLVRPLAEKKALRILVEADGAPVELHTDARKLCQILVNLLANAVKFTDAGDIVLAIRTEVDGEELRLCCDVTDSGRGIARENQEQIFDAFWQVDQPNLTRTSDGTGLGLSVARRLARLLGGDVIVTASVPGHGSTFTASLPVHSTAAAAVAG